MPNMHAEGISLVEAELSRLAYEYEKVGRRKRYDLIVHGRHRKLQVGVRYSRASGPYEHHVLVRGRRYRYDYRMHNFNFHSRGVIVEDCDIFICVARVDEGEVTFYVIPRSEVSGPTFSLHVRPNGPYQGRYKVYRGKWDELDT